MTDDFSKTYEKLQRRMIRQKMHLIWKVAQSGNLDSLNDEEKQIAGIMLEHEEFNDDFNNTEALVDYEYDPDTEVNPFMHISIHTAVESQLKQEEPLEVCEFYNAMKEKGVSHHEIIHGIGFIFIPLIFDTLKHLKSFDVERYKLLLRKYKDADPEMFEALMKEEFENQHGQDFH